MFVVGLLVLSAIFVTSNAGLAGPCFADFQCNCGKCDRTRYKCVCDKGFKPPYCTGDPCYPNPCNGGTCTRKGKCDKVCKCPPYFTGIHCQTAPFCDPKKKQCGCGHCVQYKKCVCKKGFSGPYCQQGDPCYPNPCNGGTCTRKGKCDKVCKCPPYFTGIHCQTAPFCDPKKKQCGCGHCVQYKKCVCKKGFSGPYCQQGDQCNPNPCLHGGRCIKTGSCTKKCICNKYYTGDHCQIYAPCQHIKCVCGKCVPKPPPIYFKCICDPYFRGPYCGTPFCPSDCLPNTCKINPLHKCNICCDVAVKKCYN